MKRSFMYSTAVAYVLGILSFVPPFNGLLRFYLKRHGHGAVYTATMGLFWIGNILDVVQVPQLVKDANMRRARRGLEQYGATIDRPQIAGASGADAPGAGASGADAPGAGAPTAQSIERSILRSAKNNGGITTPSEVAIESDIPIERAREALDYLVSRGFAEIRVNKSGVIVYRFPEIIDPSNPEEFEDLS